MQNSATAKTKWAPKRAHLVLTAAILVAAVLLVTLGWWLLRPVDHSVQAGSKRYVVAVANDTQERKRGLSGRESLPANQGMLFVFPESGTHCIWMKDMRFPIDVIWLNEQKQVTDLYEHMSPDSYPRSFCPPTPTRYVIELNAGQIKAADIKQGQTISF